MTDDSTGNDNTADATEFRGKQTYNETGNKEQPEQITTSAGSLPITVGKPADSEKLVYMKLLIPALFSLIVIMTCVYKIIEAEEESPELRAVWWSTLASQAGLWLPSPAKRE